MKPVLLAPFYTIFDHIRPKIICEIGTHDCKSGIQFVDYCLKYNQKLKYVGYDIFDAVEDNVAFHQKEINGKGAGRFAVATHNLKHRQKTKSKKFKFVLHAGYTTDTLTDAVYDFVYIDGGHSYNTVKFDYSKVKDSKVIVFDDYQTPGVKQFFDELVKENKIPKVEWEELFKCTKTCWTFLPHEKSAHIQPVIFNHD